MSGVTIISRLLEDHEPLLARVPLTQIKAGRLPDDAPRPSLLIRSISSTEQQPLRRPGMVRTTERVSITARVAAYGELGPLLKLLRAACAGKTGTIADFERVAVLTAGTGPDVNGPNTSFERTQDFRVSFDGPA